MAVENDPEIIFQAAQAFLAAPLVQLEQAHGWNSASSVLTATGGSVTAAAGQVAKGWGQGDDKVAFDAFLAVLRQEIDESAGSTKQNADALAKIIEELDNLQTTFFAVAATSLVTLAALAALENLPYVGPVFTALKKVEGLLLSLVTGEVVAEVAAVISMGLKPMADWVGGAGLAFARPRPNAPLAGDTVSGTDCTDINIYWN